MASAIPYAFASILMYLNSRASDNSGERFIYTTMVTLGSALSFLLLAACPPILGVQLTLIALAAGCMWASKPILFAWMSEVSFLIDVSDTIDDGFDFSHASFDSSFIPPFYQVMKGDLAVAIAFVIAVGNMGGLIGPLLMGWSKSRFGNYQAALWVLACVELLFAGCCVWAREELRKRAQRVETSVEAVTVLEDSLH